ncbi:MAG TPA: hypothetical protein VFQ39_17515, partial [Longimicrobium sp.]|nr:hypothetical protein [Longimicrobium sp.]
EELELERPGPSYTVDTLRELWTRLPGAELFLLIGADNLAELPAWRESEALVRLARLAVVTRAGERVPEDAPYPALHVPVPRVDVSSTEVRRRAAAGECIRYLVPEPVRRLIEARGLYRGPSFQSETHQGRTPC